MSNIHLGQPSKKIEQWCIDHYRPLCFTAQAANCTVALASSTEEIFVSLAYSTDNCQTWQDYTESGLEIELDSCTDKRVFFRAKTENPNGMAEDSSAYHQFHFVGPVAASGNIQFLLKSDGQIDSVPEYAFCNLFCGEWDEEAKKCVSTLAQAPALPATTLADGCYQGMFSDCTALTSSPALPATTLTDSCYLGMFYGCTSLTSAPALPATTLANYCYSYMFTGCISLKISQDDSSAGSIILGLSVGTAQPTNWNRHMFTNTAGSFTGEPEVGHTYRCYQ